MHEEMVFITLSVVVFDEFYKVYLWAVSGTFPFKDFNDSFLPMLFWLFYIQVQPVHVIFHYIILQFMSQQNVFY